MADFHTPTRDRAPVATAGFRNIDSHHLAASDVEMLGRLASLERAARRARLVLPATLAAMRTGMAGQPAAAAYGSPDQVDVDDERDPRSMLWCFTHERTVDQCDPPRLDDERNVIAGCAGVKMTGPSDPAGSAAMAVDVAVKDRARLAFLLDRAYQEMDAAMAVLAAWPVHPAEREDVEPSPGSEWCVVCWKDDRYCEPITTRASGQPYYRDRCRWCGDMTKLLGTDPPTSMVRRRHRGERISQAEIAKAKKPSKGKAKKSGRK